MTGRVHIYYGGTFDPIHHGHLAIARHAAQCFKTCVHFIPAADPPHRPPPAATAMERLHLLECALAGEDQFRIDRREIERARQYPHRPSWTIDTLRSIRAEIGSTSPLLWLLGADSLRSLSTWNEWQAILQITHLLVAQRPENPLFEKLPTELETALRRAWTDHAEPLYQQPGGRVWCMEQRLHHESATALRQRIADRQPWQHYVPPAVAHFIIDSGLYGYKKPENEA